ncbi:ribonuclease H-like domain-containing protein [Chiua virens]|nr:ribonuclease H-like domain-containing protein [Chiua virens]
MSNSDHDEDSGRLYTPCSTLTYRFSTEELVVPCPRTCGRFHARCCIHLDDVCHHDHVVYTDGACTNNGNSGAAAGIGIAFGTETGDSDDEDTQQFSIPVDDRLDPGGKRTSQRAELLAAIQGLEKFCGPGGGTAHDVRKRKKGPSAIVIITTDSEYVVKGMAEWLPNWKVGTRKALFVMIRILTHLHRQRNGLRKSNGQRPSNIDLFLKLDASIEEQERRHRIQVKFWHVDREYNTIADKLAKHAARAAAISMDEDTNWSF